jgi:hypothetical protein
MIPIFIFPFISFSLQAELNGSKREELRLGKTHPQVGMNNKHSTPLGTLFPPKPFCSWYDQLASV